MNRSWKVLFETVLTKPLLRYYHEGYRTKPFVRNLLAIIFWKVSYWALYTKPSWLFPVKVRYWTLHTKPFERFGLKVSYGTLCTKPILPFTKKKFHTKPSFGETTKGSERVPADRSFFGFVKYLFCFECTSTRIFWPGYLSKFSQRWICDVSSTRKKQLFTRHSIANL